MNNEKVEMYCCRCGKELEVLPHGAYKACCFGGGYWGNLKPLESDLPGHKCTGLHLYYTKIQGLPVRYPKRNTK